MILEFLKTLAPPQPTDLAEFDPQEEKQPDDQVIGVMEGDLLALFICEMRQRALYAAQAAEAKRLRRAYDDDPTEPNRLAAIRAVDEANRTHTRIGVITDVLTAELFELFHIEQDFAVFLCKGFQVVVRKEKNEARPRMRVVVTTMSFSFPPDPSSEGEPPPDGEPSPDGEPHP